jgi:replicative DNA helicase
MDQSILRSCLNKNFYDNIKAKLRPSLFDDSNKDIFQTITEMQDKFDRDITPLELFSFWKSKNPTATGARIGNAQDIINQIAESEVIDADIATDIIENLWRQHIGLDIAHLGILMSEGDASAMDKLQALLAKVAGGYSPNNFEDCIVTDDIYELLACVSNENRFKFNIETLSRHVYGLARGEFGVVAAYSNVGKTAFAASVSAGPAGFCQQGAKVAFICNEETGKRPKLRALMAYTGMSDEECRLEPEAAAARFSGIRDRMKFVDSVAWTLSDLDGFLTQYDFDVVFVDMADKLEVLNQFNSGHERLRELYYRLRELAKKHNIALFGMSQANADAEGKARLTPTMLEGSRVGKIAEADLLIGIGKRDDPSNPNDPARYLNIMKNKISGWHGQIQCNLNPKNFRFEV